MDYWFINPYVASAKTKNTINPSLERNLEVFGGTKVVLDI